MLVDKGDKLSSDVGFHIFTERWVEPDNVPTAVSSLARSWVVVRVSECVVVVTAC